MFLICVIGVIGGSTSPLPPVDPGVSRFVHLGSIGYGTPMDWLRHPVTGMYCERHGTGLWDEPFNAVSNISFFIAGVMILRCAMKARNRSTARVGTMFGGLTLLVGAGSLIFHTFANRLGLILDVLFIALFVHVYMPVYLVRVIGRGVIEAIGWLGAFIGCELLGNYLIGGPTCSYLITLLGLSILALAAHLRRANGKTLIFWSAVTFGISLTLRTIDQSVCDIIPTGTHWGWHLLNGLVLYLATISLLGPQNSPANPQGTKNTKSFSGSY